MSIATTENLLIKTSGQISRFLHIFQDLRISELQKSRCPFEYFRVFHVQDNGKKTSSSI